MQNDSAKVSVIVLTYKKFDRIKDNIDSILRQTYKNYEIIISDDGSPNFDKAFIEDIIKKQDLGEKFSIINREKNVGTVKNFNDAVKAASGDIIVPLAQDDRFYDENALSNIVNAFMDPRINLCLGLRAIRQTGDVLPNSVQIKIMHEGSLKKLWFRNACGNLYFGSALSYRKAFLRDIGYFDDNYVLLEDYPLAMNCIEMGEAIYVIEKPIIEYSTDGMSHGKNISQIMKKDYYRMHERNYQYADNLLKSKICKRYLLYRMKASSSPCNRFEKYSNIIVDVIVVRSLIQAALTKKQILDCRFDILWKFEMLATKIDTILSGKS